MLLWTLPLLVVAQHEQTSLYPTDQSEAPTWCTFATCNPQYSSSLGWNHGNNVIERTCQSVHPPNAFTRVDTFDITVWLYSSSSHGGQTGGYTLQIELYATNATSELIAQAVQVTVTNVRTRTVLVAPNLQEQWWVRLVSPAGSPFRHSFFYEMILSQSSNPPPSDMGNLACTRRGAHLPLCQLAGYTHSSACVHVVPAPPAPPPRCGPDCSCECCLPAAYHIVNSGRAPSRACPGRIMHQFRAGAPEQCQTAACAARFFDCPDPNFSFNGSTGFASATYEAIPACGAGGAPPPPSPSPPAQQEEEQEASVASSAARPLVLALVASTAALSVCVICLCCFLAWVRRREKRGEPVWTSLADIIAPHPTSERGTREQEMTQTVAKRGSSSR